MKHLRLTVVPTSPSTFEVGTTNIITEALFTSNSYFMHTSPYKVAKLQFESSSRRRILFYRNQFTFKREPYFAALSANPDTPLGVLTQTVSHTLLCGVYIVYYIITVVHTCKTVLKAVPF